MAIIVGISKLASNSTPVICDISDLQTGDFSKYDYFTIKGGVQIPGQMYYSKNISGINQIVYPLAPKGYVDSLATAYGQSSFYNAADLTTGFNNWLNANKIKPKVFVKQDVSFTDETQLDPSKFADSLVSGVRLVKFDGIEDKIKERMEQDGYTVDDALVIDYNKTPSDMKGEGWAALIGGLVLVGYRIIRLRTKTGPSSAVTAPVTAVGTGKAAPAPSSTSDNSAGGYKRGTYIRKE